MILGIDAFNLSFGGGVTHLVEILRNADPHKFGFHKVIIWGSASTLKQIEDRSWLCKKPLPVLESNLLRRLIWHRFQLKGVAKRSNCDVLFSPGGTALSGFYPSVTMCRNMLPFEWGEIRRFGFRIQSLKLMLLRWVQLHSFKNSSGLIFLTTYAKNSITNLIQLSNEKVTTIPHGISGSFFKRPRVQLPINAYSFEEPYTLIYVSKTDLYKHHDKLVYSVAELRRQGYPLKIVLVGPPGTGSSSLERAINTVDPDRKFVSYLGSISYDKISLLYQTADLGVFASTCENMPNILLELMASGLPIASSCAGPMPEVLGSGGEYFNSDIRESIVDCLKNLIDIPAKREKIANQAYIRAEEYSWKKCADSTFSFLEKVSKK